MPGQNRWIVDERAGWVAVYRGPKVERFTDLLYVNIAYHNMWNGWDVNSKNEYTGMANRVCRSMNLLDAVESEVQPGDTTIFTEDIAGAVLRELEESGNV